MWWLALVPIALVVVPAVWCGVVWLIGQAGWRTLARAYATDLPASGRTFRFQSGRIGHASYNGVLTISVEPEGIRLAVAAPFRPGHPPVLIPWDEISDIEPRKVLWHKSYAVKPADSGAVTVGLPGRVVEAIRDGDVGPA